MLFLRIFNLRISCISHSASTHADLWQKRLLFSATSCLVCTLFLIENEPRQYLRQIDLHKVGYQVSHSSMAIAHPHHPVVFERGKVVMDYVRILVRLLMPRYESLPGFHRIHLHRSFVSPGLRVLVLQCNLLPLPNNCSTTRPIRHFPLPQAGVHRLQIVL